MKKIKQLSPSLANQIAAGEVVERPSSVVKELLENSIDAQSQRISIEIENGGTTLIRIRDDGIGITKEELPLALARHATSKLETIDDLYCIHSLGFRGEALASIASVSRFTLTSRHQTAEHAWQLKTEGKDLTNHIEPAAHPIGSTLDVANLFYNVPARKKFLRSSRTEFINIEEVVKRIALSHFNIGLSLKHNGKNILQLQRIENNANAGSRIAKILGQNFLNNAIYFEQENQSLKLHGWFGRPEVARSQNDQQYFYINNRIIKDKLINHALRQAWNNAFPEGRFASYVLYLTLPASEVDINVHPTKHEVRFKEARLIHDFIYQTISNLLLEDTYASVDEDGVISSSEDILFNHTPDIHKQVLYQNSYITQTNDSTSNTIPSIRERTPSYQINHTTASKQPADNTPHLICLYQFGQYSFVSIKNTLHIVDLTACLSALIKKLISEIKNEHIKSQPLLLPISLTLDEKNIPKAEKLMPLLAQLMIDISVIGENSIILRALPKSLKYINWKKAFSALIQEMPEDTSETCHLLTKFIAIPCDASECNKLLTLLAPSLNFLIEKKCIKEISESLLEKLFS